MRGGVERMPASCGRGAEGEERLVKSAEMPAAAVIVQAPRAVPRDEDANLSPAFGPLFRALPELLPKIVPVERTLMLCRVSKRVRWVLMAAKPAAFMKVKAGGEGFVHLEERKRRMMSMCTVTVLHPSESGWPTSNHWWLCWGNALLT